MYDSQIESTLYSYLNVKQLLVRNMRDIWKLSATNETYITLALITWVQLTKPIMTTDQNIKNWNLGAIACEQTRIK